MKRYVDCNNWLCGEGTAASTLCRESDGKMCILGQWGVLAGIPVELLMNGAAPCTLLNEEGVPALHKIAPDYFDTFTVHNEIGEDAFVSSDYALQLMYENDRKFNGSSQPMSLRERICIIGKLGEQYGDEIIFLNVPEDQLSW